MYLFSTLVETFGGVRISFSAALPSSVESHFTRDNSSCRRSLLPTACSRPSRAVRRKGRAACCVDDWCRRLAGRGGVGRKSRCPLLHSSCNRARRWLFTTITDGCQACSRLSRSGTKKESWATPLTSTKMKSKGGFDGGMLEARPSATSSASTSRIVVTSRASQWQKRKFSLCLKRFWASDTSPAPLSTPSTSAHLAASLSAVVPWADPTSRTWASAPTSEVAARYSLVEATTTNDMEGAVRPAAGICRPAVSGCSQLRQLHVLARRPTSCSSRVAGCWLAGWLAGCLLGVGACK